ncbi:MAG: FtsX-like permease family protein [Flavobacteriales bacterium]|nr:FtsX-like permease family protein [Flavobacteriales bacterium]
MNLSNFIAKRYLFSKKNTNAINLISGISVLIFTIGTAVMIIILSLLNGLEGLVKNMNDQFDPDLKITSKYAKSFNPDSVVNLLTPVEGIISVSKIIEDNVVVRYADAQEIATIKGVDSAFTEVVSVDSILTYGSFETEKDSHFFAVFGSEIAHSLNINLSGMQTAAEFFVPKKGVEFNNLNPEGSLNIEFAIPAGVILLNNEGGTNDLVVSSLNFTRKLFDLEKNITSLELKISAETARKTELKIEETLGKNFEVKNRMEQNEAAYKVFKTEKWATFAILSLVVFIAAFNTIGALTMLVLEKKKDIKIIGSMGANKMLIRNIFLKEGLLITTLGIIMGLAIGIGFVYLQDTRGIIRLDGSFVEFFPVKLLFADLLVVSGIIFLLGLIASLYPAKKAAEFIND